VISLNNRTTADVSIEIASRVKRRRLELGITQKGMAARADIKLPTYRKFEQTGVISLDKLLNIAFALNCLSDFDTLFSQVKYNSIDDVVNEKALKERKRGNKE